MVLVLVAALQWKIKLCPVLILLMSDVCGRITTVFPGQSADDNTIGQHSCAELRPTCKVSQETKVARESPFADKRCWPIKASSVGRSVNSQAEPNSPTEGGKNLHISLRWRGFFTCLMCASYVSSVAAKRLTTRPVVFGRTNALADKPTAYPTISKEHNRSSSRWVNNNHNLESV